MRVGIEMSYDPRSVNESDNQVINDRSLPSIGIMMILRVESLDDLWRIVMIDEYALSYVMSTHKNEYIQILPSLMLISCFRKHLSVTRVRTG